MGYLNTLLQPFHSAEPLVNNVCAFVLLSLKEAHLILEISVKWACLKLETNNKVLSDVVSKTKEIKSIILEQLKFLVVGWDYWITLLS